MKVIYDYKTLGQTLIVNNEHDIDLVAALKRALQEETCMSDKEIQSVEVDLSQTMIEFVKDNG
jgi:hypothetical protein